ncbi:MAG: DUF481 domain-containing protein [Bryobacteraceae bacterium]
MNNGDRLTGSVIKVDEKELTIKSDLAGTVKILWDAVEAIQSSAPLNVFLKSGQRLAGRVSTVNGRLQVATADVGTVEVAKAGIEAIRSEQEQTAFQAELDRLRNPGLLDLWNGYFDTGISLARGNARTSTFNLGMNAARTTRRDKTTAYFTSLFANNSTTGVRITTANAVRGGIGYNLNVSQRTFAFAGIDLEFDEFQKLDLRFVPGGGLGVKAIDTEKRQLNLLLGGNLNKSFFSTGEKRSNGEIQAGEELTLKMSAVNTFRQKLVVYPNLSEGGEYRMNFDASLITAVAKWLSWQITLSDRYISNPVFGAKRNDVLATTGLRITFAK